MKFLSVFIVSTIFLFGCSQKNNYEYQKKYSKKYVHPAHAVMVARSGSDVRGSFAFYKAKDGVRIKGKISGLDSNGTHGFHVHENGDCSASDASSAGGHFAGARGKSHGKPQHDHSHAGDLGNVSANAKGVAKIDLISDKLCLNESEACGIIGRSLIVHAKADDLKSQPSGAAGARIGCALIQMSTK